MGDWCCEQRQGLAYGEPADDGLAERLSELRGGDRAEYECRLFGGTSNLHKEAPIGIVDHRPGTEGWEMRRDSEA